jgi:hypothetical protein
MFILFGLLIGVTLIMGLVAIVLQRKNANSNSDDKADIVYPISQNIQPTLQKPTKGETKKPQYRVSGDECALVNALRDKSKTLKEKQRVIENKLISANSSPNVSCDLDCASIYISQLYESYLIKHVLQNMQLSSAIIAIYQDVFAAIDPTSAFVAEWGNSSKSMFPANQKNRDWQLYNTPFSLTDTAGITQDSTRVLLSGDFLKHLQDLIPAPFKAERDRAFNTILKRMRGMRINHKFKAGDPRGSAMEKQIGILNMDYPPLTLEGRYYDLKPWEHPGRMRCGTNPLQGMFQHAAYDLFVPLECGLSGSTNFWVWTALFAQVNMTLEETRLYLLSAFIVLGGDGGHSLMEVLGSATVTAIYWHEYARYSKSDFLIKYLKGSNFADNLYEVTKTVNPMGSEPVIPIDRQKIGDLIYNSGDEYFEYFNDAAKLPAAEIKKRQEVEAFFLGSGDRRQYDFGNYGAFFDTIPDLAPLREKTIQNLIAYTAEYC